MGRTPKKDKKAPKPKPRKLKAAKPAKVARKKTTVKRTPRNANLPGMEGVRDVVDEISEQCGVLTDIRNQMTDLREARASALNNSLALLQKHRRAFYADRGTEVALKPGAPTVVARASKGQQAVNGSDDTPDVKEPEWDDEDTNEDLADGITEAASR